MIHLLFFLALTSSCNIVGSTQYCTSTSTVTTSNCSMVFTYPPYQCSETTLASISINSSEIQQPPPQWVTSISDQINSINALGWAPNGWFEVVGISKLIAVPAYFVIKKVRQSPRFKDSKLVSYTAIGGLTILFGMIGFFGLLSLLFFSVCLGGAWLVSYPYLIRFQRGWE